MPAGGPPPALEIAGAPPPPRPLCGAAVTADAATARMAREIAKALNLLVMRRISQTANAPMFGYSDGSPERALNKRFICVHSRPGRRRKNGRFYFGTLDAEVTRNRLRGFIEALAELPRALICYPHRVCSAKNKKALPRSRGARPITSNADDQRVGALTANPDATKAPAIAIPKPLPLPIAGRTIRIGAAVICGRGGITVTTIIAIRPRRAGDQRTRRDAANHACGNRSRRANALQPASTQTPP